MLIMLANITKGQIMHQKICSGYETSLVSTYPQNFHFLKPTYIIVKILPTCCYSKNWSFSWIINCL